MSMVVSWEWLEDLPQAIIQEQSHALLRHVNHCTGLKDIWIDNS